jgi:hypothetical protein
MAARSVEGWGAMRWGVSGGLLGLVLLGTVPSALAQEVGELFARINPSVVVIRAKGRDVTARGSGNSPRPAPASSCLPTATS